MVSKSRAFLLCFESHRAAARGDVWAVKVGRRWTFARDVSLLVPVVTVYRRGPQQPKAYLQGAGVIRRYGDTLVITR